MCIFGTRLDGKIDRFRLNVRFKKEKMYLGVDVALGGCSLCLSAIENIFRKSMPIDSSAKLGAVDSLLFFASGMIM